MSLILGGICGDLNNSCNRNSTGRIICSSLTQFETYHPRVAAVSKWRCGRGVITRSVVLRWGPQIQARTMLVTPSNSKRTIRSAA